MARPDQRPVRSGWAPTATSCAVNSGFGAETSHEAGVSENHATSSSTSSGEIEASGSEMTPFMSLLRMPVRTAIQPRPRLVATLDAPEYARSRAMAAR